MADYIFARKSRNIASSAVHILLNILLGMGAVLVTVFSGSPILGIILVVISKWRMFAVRRRYLWLNIKSNLVDLIVGLSIVFLAYSAGSSFAVVDFILMAVYTVWLIFVKPMSSERANLVQALFAVFLGISASTIMTASFFILKHKSFRQNHITIIVKHHIETKQVVIKLFRFFNVFNNNQYVL